MENEFENQGVQNPQEDGFTQAPTNQMEGNGQFQQGFENGNQPYYTQGNGQEVPKESQTLAIVGMVLGILSLLCCCVTYLSIVLAVVSLVLSIVSIVQKKPGKGMAIAGIVCSAVALVIGVVAIILSFAVFDSLTESDWQQIIKEIQNASNS